MADEVDARPAFGELLMQSQSALAGLQALEEHLSTRLADQHAQLNASRAELEQARGAMGTLQSAHDRLTAEHARTLDEVAHQRQARTELEATILDVRRELAEALRERRALLDARDKERRELEDRLGLKEKLLAERLGRITALEAQLDELTAAQVSWHSDRAALIEARDQLAGRLGDLEAGERQAADDLARAITNREQLRAVFEELKRTHAAAGERSAAAFREMARLQDELRVAAEQAAALEAELASARLAVTEGKSATEAEVAQLRQQAATLELQLTDERERLDASLATVQEQLRRAAESTANAEKGRAEAQAQYVSLVERAQAAAQEWAARRQAMLEENRRTAEDAAKAQQGQRTAEEGQRQLQRQVQQLEQAHRDKIAGLEDRVRAAEDAATRPLSAEQSHRINTRLNAIVGFADILLDPKANAIAPSEEADYIRLINENSRGLAEELNLVSVAGAPPATGSASAAGPAVASLGGTAPPPTVLVADSDPAVRERLFPFLTRAGYDVVFVASGEEAVLQARALAPLLILAEATLAPGGASSLIAQLKRDPRTADIPVVVITKNAAEPLGVDLGQVDVLSKPIDRQQLLQMMINHDLQSDARRAQKLPARVLVIDDDPLSLRLLTAVLKPLQIEVITADGGKAGIELAKQHNPQLIICDLMMPEVDGFSVIAALRSDPQMSAVPILVYTGKHITAEDQERLKGLIPSIIRKGEFSRERFLEVLLKRGERRARGTTPPIAA